MTRMNQIINIHADDYAVGDEISENILDSINNGVVNSISIICNTENFINNTKKLKNVAHDIRLNLHLNLVEGFSVAPQSEVLDIVDENGEFKYSFLTLWLKYSTSPTVQRSKIRNQIKIEIIHQIEKYCAFFNNKIPLRIDSHMHFHMIPFIFDIIMNLSKSYDISFVRIPYELRYVSFSTIKNYLSSNLIKNILLNILSRYKSSNLDKRNINRNEYFVGVFGTGNVTIQYLNSALKEISKKSIPKSVDILLHPGGVRSKKSITWTSKEMFKLYYSSINREKERKVLKNQKTKNMMFHYETFFNN